MNKYIHRSLFFCIHQSFRSYDTHEINAQTASGESTLQAKEKESFDVFLASLYKKERKNKKPTVESIMINDHKIDNFIISYFIHLTSETTI